jgi:hypothetical protein
MALEAQGNLCRHCETVRPLESFLESNPNKCKSCIQDTYRWRIYAVSPEAYADMLADQGFVCAICQGDHKLNIDHDHETGKVRGLLCTSCNVALGAFKDDIESLYRAIRYMMR